MEVGRINILCVSDIHFGEHYSSSKLYNELIQKVLYTVRDKKDELDMVIINGDYWGTKLSLNSMDAKLGISFINELYTVCKENDILIRMIRGTLSHDHNQLGAFKYLEDEDRFFFRIINNMESEEIELEDTEDPVKILYVPEEYLEDSKSYYDDVLKPRSWDLIFGHGTFDFTAFSSQKILSERSLKSAPILDSKKFNAAVKGAVIFGHIHIRDDKDNVCYSGSFSRLNFGEEEPKGFYVLSYSKVSEEVELEFIENDLAPIYHTEKLSNYFKKDTIFTENNIKEKVLVIEQLKKKYKGHKLRIIDDTNNVSNFSSKVLKDRYGSDEDITLKLQTIEQEVVRDDTFDFILKKEYSVPETVKRFIEIKYGMKIETEEIATVLEENERI